MADMEYATSADGQVAIAQDGEFVLHPVFTLRFERQRR